MDKILEYFIDEPYRQRHLREIAKLVKRSPATVSKYLEKLKKEGIIDSKRELGHLLFRANLQSQKFRDLKLSYNIRKIKECGLIDYLAEELNHPKTIVLFGSFAKAENTLESDIDILVITPINKEMNLSKFEKILGHKIHLFLYSSKEIERMKIKNKELLNNFINGFVLYGSWEVF